METKNLTIERKIQKLKEFGVSVSVTPLNQGQTGSNYNEFKIFIPWTKEQMHQELDKKLQIFEDKPWLKELTKIKPLISICELCINYNFKLQYENGYLFTYETCAKEHFKDILKHKHELILNCKDKS